MASEMIRILDTIDERAARHFACDCAERVLPLYERRISGDTRLRDALAVARRFANGTATARELRAAGNSVHAAQLAAAKLDDLALNRAATAVLYAAVLDGGEISVRDAALVAARNASEAAGYGVDPDAIAGWDDETRVAARTAEGQWQMNRLAGTLPGEVSPPQRAASAGGDDDDDLTEDETDDR